MPSFRNYENYNISIDKAKAADSCFCQPLYLCVMSKVQKQYLTVAIVYCLSHFAMLMSVQKIHCQTDR